MSGCGGEGSGPLTSAPCCSALWRRAVIFRMNSSEKDQHACSATVFASPSAVLGQSSQAPTLCKEPGLAPCVCGHPAAPASRARWGCCDRCHSHCSTGIGSLAPPAVLRRDSHYPISQARNLSPGDGATCPSSHSNQGSETRFKSRPQRRPRASLMSGSESTETLGVGG